MKPHARSKWLGLALLVLLSAGVVWQQQRPTSLPAPLGPGTPEQDAPAVPAPSRPTDGGRAGAAGQDISSPIANPMAKAAPAPAPASPRTAPLPGSREEPANAKPSDSMPLEPLISETGKQSKIARDGTPLRIELNPGQPASTVELQAWTNDQTRNATGHYDWRFKLTVPAGGVVERLDPAVFTAPEAGYLKTFDYAMDQNQPANEWANSFGKSFFVHFDNDTYGLLNVQMVAGGAHFTTVKAYLNPANGSRNLRLPPPPPVKAR